MIIAIDARSLFTTPRTGVGEFTYGLLSHLFQNDTENRYLLFSNAFETQQDRPFSEYKNVTWITSRIPNKLLHISLALFQYPKLDTLVAKKAGVKNIDVWFSPNLHFTSLSKRVRHILMLHDLSFLHYPQFFSIKGRLWHRSVHPKKQIAKANTIFVPSAHSARDVIQTYTVNKEQVHVIHPAVGTSIVAHRESSSERMQNIYDLPKLYMLYLGTLEPRKNIEGILEAYAKSAFLKKKCPIVFAGALGYKGKKYKQMIEQTEGALYMGYVDEGDKYALYSSARVLVYPSLYEGFGLPVLEALTCGTPVIASHRASLPEVVGEAGILVNPYNTDELRKAMERVVHKDTLYNKLQSQTQQQVNTFSWDAAIQTLMDIYENRH